MAHRIGLVVASASLIVLMAARGAAAPVPCLGDCNADGRVVINELLLMVNEALGGPAYHCGTAEGQTVNVAIVVSAVGFALEGCPALPEASPTMDATPIATADPAAPGACFESAACEACETPPCRTFASPRGYCCERARMGGSFSWCPEDQFDVPTLSCKANCVAACDGVPPSTVGPSATPSPMPTPTSCRAVIPVVAPVTPQTNELEQTITLCGIGFGTSRVNACGPAGCVEEFTTLSEGCPLQCTDSRQACVSGRIPLLPNQADAIQVCQVPGVGCGPLPDLCAEEDVNGAPLVIQQGSPEPTVDPADSGACFESAACDTCDVYPCKPFGASRGYCCSLVRSGARFSWCPIDQFDAETNSCAGGCTAPCAGLPTPTPTPATPSPIPTATSCRAVIPVVAPVPSSTEELEATIILCGIGYSASRVNACGPAGCIEEYDYVDDCPLLCPDSRQACVMGKIPLLPNQANAIEVCQVPGVGCGPLPDLCAEEDVNGTPLVIEQHVTESTDCQCLLNGGQPDENEDCPCDVGACFGACIDERCPNAPNCMVVCSVRCSCNAAPSGCITHIDPGATPTQGARTS